MLPPALCRLSTRQEGEYVVPEYLSERDEPWLRALLDEHARFVGQPREALRARLQEPLPVSAPKVKRRIAVHVLDQLGWTRPNTGVPPREARWLLFRAAASQAGPRDGTLEAVASALAVTPAALEASLFADLPHEQRVAALPADLSAARLGVMANQALLAALLHRSAAVRVRAWGNARALVRYARQVGLICIVRRAAEPPSAAALRATWAGAAAHLESHEREQLHGFELHLSGPFALFRRTHVYGRALASLVPRAAACSYFELEAECALGRGGHLSRVLVRAQDPIAVPRALPDAEARLQARLVRDLRRVAPEWDVTLDPNPLEADGALIFPDLTLVRAGEPQRRWWLEILGFWTPAYVKQKLARMQSARLHGLILCIDEKRGCSDEPLPSDARVIRYRQRIDVKAVLQAITAAPGNRA